MTAQRVCAVADLVQDEAQRFEVDGVPMALVLDSLCLLFPALIFL